MDDLYPLASFFPLCHRKPTIRHQDELPKMVQRGGKVLPKFFGVSGAVCHSGNFSYTYVYAMFLLVCDDVELRFSSREI